MASKMPKKGVHPLMRTFTVVMRNGASIQMASVLNRTTPYALAADKTTHPAWTGEKQGISTEDERIARLLKRYEGFIDVEEGTAADSDDSKQQ